MPNMRKVPKMLKVIHALVHRPLCLLNWHLPDRHKAKWDGFNYVSTCLSCHRNLRRVETSRMQTSSGTRWVRDRRAPQGGVNH